MKILVRLLIGFAIGCFAVAAPANAQGNKLTLTAGTLNINFEATFISYLNSQGITVMFHKDEVMDSGTFNLVDGTLDSKTGAGEVRTSGKITLESGSIKIDLMSLVFDTSEPKFPKVTALEVVNGVFEGRVPIFTIVSGEAYTLPLEPGMDQSPIGYFAGTRYLDFFQIVRPPSGTLVGSYSVSMTLTPKE